MFTTNYILKDVKTLSPSDKVGKAQDLFRELTFTHLIVVEDGFVLGMISEQDIQTIDTVDKPLSDFKYLYQLFFSLEKANWFELLKLFALNDTNVLPVLDQEKKYIGYYELSDVLQLFNNTPFLSESGALLVVSKNITDYSFSEIAQIVESNAAKFLGVFVSKINKETIEITIKLTDHDLNNTIQTFRRYGYTILTDFQVDEYIQTLKERSDYLHKYLNI